MVRHLFITGASLLVAAFIWGCQDQATSPVAPDALGPQFGHKGTHNPGGGDGGGDGGKTAAVQPTQGITAPAGQRIKKEADGKKWLNVNGGLTNVTIALGTNANCDDPLKVDDTADRKFVMVIDRKGGTGNITLKWPPDAITQELFLKDAVVQEVPPFVSHPTNATFTLTAGDVTVNDRPSGAMCNFPNATTVMVDVGS